MSSCCVHPKSCWCFSPLDNCVAKRFARHHAHSSISPQNQQLPSMHLPMLNYETKNHLRTQKHSTVSPFLFIWFLWIWLCNESPFTDVSSSVGNIDEAFVMEISRFEFWYFCTVFDELPEAILVTQSGYGIQMSTFLVGCYLQHKHIDHWLALSPGQSSRSCGEINTVLVGWSIKRDVCHGGHVIHPERWKWTLAEDGEKISVFSIVGSMNS